MKELALIRRDIDLGKSSGGVCAQYFIEFRVLQDEGFCNIRIDRSPNLLPHVVRISDALQRQMQPL
jgi:hypothetical protein